jgi:branched-chain amino acid aminotransferase
MNGITRPRSSTCAAPTPSPSTEKNFSLVETYSADEAFLTGTFGAQTPVGRSTAAPSAPARWAP